MRTWMQRLPREFPESGRSHMQALFDHAIDKGLKFTRTYAKNQMLPTPELSIIACLCNILTAFFDFMAKNGGFGKAGKSASTLYYEVSIKIKMNASVGGGGSMQQQQ